MSLSNTLKRPALAVAFTASLIAGFEGYRSYVYLDPVKVPTVCFGATRDSRGNPFNPSQVGQAIPGHECEKLLFRDVFEFQDAVLNNVKVPLTDNQLTALTSFTYNVGEANLKSSTLLKKLNAGDYEGACKELPRWVYAKGIKLPGLVKRRQAEMELCLTPDSDIG